MAVDSKPLKTRSSISMAPKQQLWVVKITVYLNNLQSNDMCAQNDYSPLSFT